MAEGPVAAPEQHSEDVEAAHSTSSGSEETDSGESKKPLPACKLRRNYYCKTCAFCTVNPREYLYHLRDEHGERLQIYECSDCVYASRGKVKLARHVRMVHGDGQNQSPNNAAPSTDEVKSNSPKPADSSQQDTPAPRQLSMSPLPTVDEVADVDAVLDTADEVNEDINSPAVADLYGADEMTEVVNMSETEEGGETELLSESEHVMRKKSKKKKKSKTHPEDLGGLKKKFYRCSKCEYTTHIRSRYSKHVRYHSMPMIKCELCEFQTPYKWNLDRHMKNHNNDGAYKCNICSFSSQIKQSLTVHIQNHHLPQENAGIDFTGGFADLVPAGIARDPLDEEDLLRMEREEDEVLSDMEDNSDQHENSSDTEGEHEASGDFPDKLTSPGSNGNGSVKKNGLLKSANDLSKKAHGSDQSSSKTIRSPPSLIPIPGQSLSTAPTTSAPTDSTKSKMERLAEEAAIAFLSTDTSILDSKGPMSVLDRLFNKRMLASGPVEGSSADSVNFATKPTQPDNKFPIAPSLSSTRCQHCRHRCKSTDDLRLHQRLCSKATSVATKLQGSGDSDGMHVLDAGDSPVDNGKEAETKSFRDEDRVLPFDRNPVLVKKRVFKCPQCSFWATTASRFHIHLVGHMNMKPYECSVCGYRSNWRWDITKHIKLKSAKSADHLKAQLLIKDLGDSDKYDKYEVFCTTMEVEDGLQCKPQENSSAASRRSRCSSPMRPCPPIRAGFTVPPNVTITPHPGPLQLNRHSAPQLAGLPLPPPLIRAPQPPRSPALGSAVSTPNLEALKRLDPSLAAMDLTTNNTAIVLPEPPPDVSATAGGTDNKSGKKATVWRCKKCNFKHPDREVVRIHFRAHLCDTAGVPDALYACGHCEHASLWKHVIERHCRSKHGGNISVVEHSRSAMQVSSMSTDLFATSSATTTAPKLGSDVSISVVSRADGQGPGSATFRCDICTFVCANTDAAISAHMRHHTPQPGSVYKCMFCPYYVPTQTELLEHLSLHVVTSSSVGHPNESLAAVAAIDKLLQASSAMENLPAEFYRYGEAPRQDTERTFLCQLCPFSTDERLLHLAHEQLHGVGGRAHRCPVCSFGAQQRPQLEQHVLLHGLRMRTAAGEPPSGLPSDGDGRKYSRRPLMQKASVGGSAVAGPVLEDERTQHLPDVPLVWVSRGGKFFKMFKCRQCPHVNLRKSNIQDHERMHVDRDVVGYAHRCTRCNYVCVNAGVLSSHVKVHTYSLGKIHALVDPHSSDEDQLRAIIGDDELLDDSSTDPPLPGVETEQAPAGVQTASAGSPSPQTDQQRQLFFCQHCPARFFHQHEIDIHARFHGLSLPFACVQCSYTSRQQQHLQAHAKVHTDEYAERSRSLLSLYVAAEQYPPAGFGGSRNALLAAAAAELRVPVPPQYNQQPAISVPPLSRTSSTNSSAVPTTVQHHHHQPKVSPKRHSCSLCPARFVKEATLRYHMTLHGCDAPFRCNKCSYAVKTYGNLTQHINQHIEADMAAAMREASNSSPSSNPDGGLNRGLEDFPMSGLDLLKRKLDFQKEQHPDAVVPTPARKIARTNPPPAMSALRPTDPYYAERSGNPDFVYPTVTDRYGREREKRYKCRKCPSAFEKREQYMKHISLHGVPGRFTCTHCDYAVNYYPNFCNHMKRHGVPPLPMSEASNRVPMPAAVVAIKLESSTSQQVDGPTAQASDQEGEEAVASQTDKTDVDISQEVSEPMEQDSDLTEVDQDDEAASVMHGIENDELKMRAEVTDEEQSLPPTVEDTAEAVEVGDADHGPVVISGRPTLESLDDTGSAEVVAQCS